MTPRRRHTGRRATRASRLGAVVLTLLAIPVGRATGGDHFDACVRHLRRAMTAQRAGSHLHRLFALRQLRDPALEPFFRYLAERPDWQVQVHAVLALAEIAPEPRLDSWLVTQMGERGQETLIASAIDLGLLPHAQMRELVGGAGLHPMPWLMLVAELQLAGDPPDAVRLAPLASGLNLRIAGLASLLAAQAGDSGILSAYDDRLAAMPRRERDAQLLWMLDAIRQYRLSAAQPWVERRLEDPQIAPDVRYWSVFTLLVLDPATALPAWRATLGPDPSYGDRVRCGMLLLAAGADVPAEAYAAIEGDFELTARMAAAGRAMSRGTDPTAALNALIDLGHHKTASWVMDVTPDLPPQQASGVLEHVLEIVEGDSSGRADRVARAVQAAALLFEIDRPALREHLARVDDDSLAQEVILLGLFDVHDPAAGAAAASVRRIGAGRADTLALLLTARYDARVDRDRLRQLGVIAAGGGRVSEGLQTQAAWLYLRHANRTDEAIGIVFDES